MRATPPYVPGEQPQPGRRVIKLNTNENPYPPSPRVLDAMRRGLADELRLYPDPEATALRQRAALTYGVPADAILVGNGSDELLSLLVRAVVDPGQAVAYPVPTYSLYRTLVALQDARAVEVPYPADWSLPPGLAEAAAPLTFVCNPNAPSGTVVPIDEIAALARRVRGVLVVDEAYVDFATDNALRLLPEHPNLVVLRTLSKSFSLAGLRVGLAFGHPELLDGLRTVKDSYNVSRLTQLGAEAALADLPAMQANVRRIVATRAVLAAELEQLGFEVPPSEANFVLARRPGRPMGAVARALAERGILVRHFAVPGLDDALRITVGTDDEVAALLAALREVCRDA
ncbi:MAG TPA: histidinol-phosphate transaminase [Candidatus Limnocylindria bacterium]|nr:histidinol-phosphate transaminase [Candidatus Limnocylindria bacterium]